VTDMAIRQPAAPAVPLTLRLAVRDIGGITRRNLLRIIRTPQLLFMSVVQPTIILLLFRYVLGGAIRWRSSSASGSRSASVSTTASGRAWPASP
jgi:hypothetical protein